MKHFISQISVKKQERGSISQEHAQYTTTTFMGFILSHMLTNKFSCASIFPSLLGHVPAAGLQVPAAGLQVHVVYQACLRQQQLIEINLKVSCKKQYHTRGGWLHWLQCYYKTVTRLAWLLHNDIHQAVIWLHSSGSCWLGSSGSWHSPPWWLYGELRSASLGWPPLARPCGSAWTSAEIVPRLPTCPPRLSALASPSPQTVVCCQVSATSQLALEQSSWAAYRLHLGYM